MFQDIYKDLKCFKTYDENCKKNSKYNIKFY